MEKFFTRMGLVLIFVITVIVIYAVFSGVASENGMDAVWNNGTHAECGGEWHFAGILNKGKHSSRIVYECDLCGHLFGTPNVYNKEVNNK